jgi:phosphoribosylaminoimidazolecarboxamide formyltransferase/IMP cyclohydrolase
VAPEFSAEALEILVKKKNLRLLIPNQDYLETKFDIKGYGKGLLVQEAQYSDDNEEKWETVTEQKPQNQFYEALRLGWHLVKHVKSNAIALADKNGSIGVGAGQMSRVDALKIAIRKAGEAGLDIKNAIMASDAFFPFRDSINLAVEHGVVGVIQPGGSVRDKEVIEACNEHGLFMLFTHKRVFKH